ncbi:dihydroorotate dehydrogenase (fumarate) [Malonomonas rubra DSM 5091]|uniref:Dihydroorotate dehydrogenase (Fumarate) n=1 Tax=Malonomonas rubra DSM 5091 TaxID=1122189 RepID=A0A1M6FCM2_MALRU|nr:dihydroorotate dehydrogenase-like protein [Malonomonas rubra]SHI95422.1 dihydroorotate dehydrogenase (fumarate) [Malonomonas rubra DSM 5091]
MSDLSTRYLGLELKNPLVIASCGLTSSLQGIQNCANSGAGAIVLKSLFEEQINADIAALREAAGEFAQAHTEAFDYLEGYAQACGPQEYLQLIREAKKSVDIPLIASINCITAERWAEYAAQLEAAGADALEVNVGFLANSMDLSSTEVEARYQQILRAVKEQVKIPVALKIGPYFSSFGQLAQMLSTGEQAADALVLFNRFYRLDIDVDKLQVNAGNPYSSADELHTSLRWIMLLAGKLDCQLAATTGIHSGKDVAKQLLAGADVTQICSVIYEQGFAQVQAILDQLQSWMQQQGFNRIDDFRGKLSQQQSSDPESYERLQYIKGLTGLE